MKENQKYWAKNDEIKLSDVREGEAPVDKFKQEYHERQYKNSVATKVQTINHWQDLSKSAKSLEFKAGHVK